MSSVLWPHATEKVLLQCRNLLRDARQKLSRRPWRVDTLDQLSEAWINGAQHADEAGSVVPSPYRRYLSGFKVDKSQT